MNATLIDASPSLVFADQNGNIMDFEPLAMIGRSGDYFLPVEPAELIPMPPGSQLYVLPDRHPVGLDRETGEIVVLERNPYDNTKLAYAVAVFLPAAHTQTYLAAWQGKNKACILPLFAYTAVGWQDGFAVTALRTDFSDRQDPDKFNMENVHAGVAAWKADFPSNRLVRHLSHCALCYGCPAALNLFQGREEGPLPTSPACNAACIGCISFQEDCKITPPQDRINFIPSPEEIAEVALKHIETVRKPVVSFGQGCEGEPLLVADTILKAIKLIRSKTDRGTINLNSNASLPEKIAELADAGLNSLRISMNSAREETYNTYFRPKFKFSALSQSAAEMKKRDGFVSINLFVFPGLTDAPKEAQALKRFVTDNRIDMIQWRNQNIDPDFYMEKLAINLPAGGGIKKLIDEMSVRRGYFNPYLGQ